MFVTCASLHWLNNINGSNEIGMSHQEQGFFLLHFQGCSFISIIFCDIQWVDNLACTCWFKCKVYVKNMGYFCSNKIQAFVIYASELLTSRCQENCGLSGKHGDFLHGSVLNSFPNTFTFSYTLVIDFSKYSHNVLHIHITLNQLTPFRLNLVYLWNILLRMYTLKISSNKA